MIETIKMRWEAKIAIVLFIFLTIWWLILQFPQTHSDILNSWFGASYGILALLGAICGFVIAHKWGGIKSVFGKALTMFAFGLLLQEFGQLAYFYYFFILHIPVPYPSIGDIGYFGSIPFYAYGTLLLAKTAGVKLNDFRHKLFALFLPMVMLIGAYYLFLQGHEIDWTNPLQVFLDFGYPFGQAIYISFAIATYFLSRGVLGGIMKRKVLWILFALLAQFIADYTFLYQTSRGTWTAGQINDYMYLFAYFIMALSLIQMGMVYDQLKHKE